jgi:hypothetical protein
MGDKTKGLYGKFIVQRADGCDQHDDMGAEVSA